MCLNGLYDLQHPAKALPASVSEWLLYSLVGVIVFSALLAALGPAPTSSRIRTGGLLQWLSTYRTFVASLFMTCGAAYLYATVHRLTQT
jgi:hypothetical protein